MRFAAITVLTLVQMISHQAGAQDLSDLTDLADEPSRAQLFSLVKAAKEAEDPTAGTQSIEFFNLWGPFRFPNDAMFDVTLNQPRSGSIFGIDISHHNKPGIPFMQLERKKVRFVFAKATQGTRFKDGKFADYWRELASTKVHRGAYHFLSAGVEGAAQAKTYLRVLQANGGLRETDMPPVMDLEWDKATADGPDRWRGKSANEIVDVALAFLHAVEAGTGRKPVIYTARAWVRQQPGLDEAFSRLNEFPIWTADYSKTSRASEAPSYPGDSYELWQFTDSAQFAAGYDGQFDANVFKGTEAEFLKIFNLTAF